MSNALYLFFVLGALAIIGFSTSRELRDHFRGGTTGITIAEERQTIRLTSYFPREKTAEVQDFIRNYFGINDLPDMRAVEINEYRTPDSSMSFYLRSREGFIEIAMDRYRNSQAAYERIKSAGTELNMVLTGKK